MSVIENLSVDTLSLRGLQEEFNRFGRLFKSRADALQAVAINDFVPVPGIINSVLIMGEQDAIQFWSFDLQTFVPVKDFQAIGSQARKYIDLDGVNDYIGFSNAADLLDFTQDWTIGISLVGVTGPQTSEKMTLFSRGGVHITLQASANSTNWGLYVTSDNNLFSTATRAQANTWEAPQQTSKLLFIYCSTTKRLQYFIGNSATGTYNQRANLAIPQSMIDGQNIAGGLEIGNYWSGTGGLFFSGVNWNGGVNNLIASSIKFTSPFIQEYFQNVSSDPDEQDAYFESAEFYSDLSVYCPLGEDTYPDVVDKKGTLTDGELYNGTAEDFKDIPTS